MKQGVTGRSLENVLLRLKRSQYTNLVKISQKQYSCIKRNFKSSLVFYIFDMVLLFTNQKEMTLCSRGSSLLCFELEVLISESAYMPLCCW